MSEPLWTAKARHPYWHNIGRTGTPIIESGPLTRADVDVWCARQERADRVVFDVLVVPIGDPE